MGVGISADGPHVVIRVENTGSIPEDEIPRVFDRLHRGEHSRDTPGTGLGLTIARAVMDVHGGSITIANSGAGSVVVAMNVPGGPRGPLILPCLLHTIFTDTPPVPHER